MTRWTIARVALDTNHPSKPVLRLLPPQRVADNEQIAPLQYKIEDTARLLWVSRWTVEQLIARGELATVGRGKLRRIPYNSIVAYQNRHRNDEAA